MQPKIPPQPYQSTRHWAYTSGHQGIYQRSIHILFAGLETSKLNLHRGINEFLKPK
jgi:hypothetical protein